MMARFTFLAIILAGFSSAIRADDWPRFRGPSGMGVTTERGLPTTWSDETNLVWSVALPGTRGNASIDQNQSSPIVVGGRVFVTLATWPEGRAKSEFPDQHVACFGAADGRLIWDTLVEPGPWKLTDLRGGYAAPTPAADNERVYVVFGSSVVVALDFAGKTIWRHDLEDHAGFDVAIASSPIVHRGHVLLLCERNGGKSTLTAYDAKTGETRWRQKRPEPRFSHSTPVVAEISGREQLLVSASHALQGVDPANGEILWQVKTPGDVCSPTLSGGLIYTDSGRGGKGVLVDPAGTGDLTATNIRWTGPQMSEGLSSPVVAAGHLFRLNSPGVLKCLDFATGKEAHTTRLDGVSAASSPVVAPEGLVYLASSGKSYIVRAGPTYELVATNDLGDPSAASMAVSNGRLFFKGRQKLYCVGRRP